MSNVLDLLVFGPHPDDVELGVGGTVALHAQEGYQVGICDLTRGELGTNGTPEIRAREAKKAAEILGASVRENLSLPDGFIRVNDQNLKKAIQLIRYFRPKVILAIDSLDDHPDHVHTSQLITEAAHLSGLYNYPVQGERHRPDNIYYYIAARPREPEMVVDISPVHDKKIEAILAHKSQLGLVDSPDTPSKSTRLTHPSFIERIKSRDRYVGSLANCEFGEGFIPYRTPRVTDFFSLGGE